MYKDKKPSKMLKTGWEKSGLIKGLSVWSLNSVNRIIQNKADCSRHMHTQTHSRSLAYFRNTELFAVSHKAWHGWEKWKRQRDDRENISKPVNVWLRWVISQIIIILVCVSGVYYMPCIFVGSTYIRQSNYHFYHGCNGMHAYMRKVLTAGGY